MCSNILTKCDLYSNIEEFQAFWEKYVGVFNKEFLSFVILRFSGLTPCI